jgi:hypothetical protein
MSLDDNFGVGKKNLTKLHNSVIVLNIYVQFAGLECVCVLRN